MKKTIFNVILDAILRNLDISASSIGLKSEFRSRKTPPLSDLTKSIEDLKQEAKKLIINPNSYVKMCIILFDIIQAERKKYCVGSSNATNMTVDALSICTETIEESAYEDLKCEITSLKNEGIEMTAEKVADVLSNILMEAYHLAKVSSNLVKQLAYNATTIQQDTEEIMNVDEKQKEINYRKILNFDNIGKQVPLVGEPGVEYLWDVTSFALHFRVGVEEGLRVILAKDIWEDKDKKVDLLSDIIDEDLIYSENTYEDFKIKYFELINLNDATLDSLNMPKLLGCILASNKSDCQQYFDLFPKHFILDKQSLLEGVEKIRNLPKENWIDNYYKLLIPTELILKRERLVREVFENIIFQFDDGDKLDYFLSTMCLNIQQSQDSNSIETMLTLMNASVYYDLSQKYEPERYLAKKELGIWSPMFTYSEAFEADCIDCINSISQEVANRVEAIEFARKIREFYKITNNERGVEICSESIIQLYMSTDDDYIAMKNEFWDNSDGELTDLLNQLNEINEEHRKAVNCKS